MPRADWSSRQSEQGAVRGGGGGILGLGGGFGTDFRRRCQRGDWLSDCFNSLRACSLSSLEILPGRLFARRGGFDVEAPRPNQPDKRRRNADMGVSRMLFSLRCFWGFGAEWWPFGR